MNCDEKSYLCGMDNIVAIFKAVFLASVAVVFAAVPQGLTLSVVVIAALANLFGALAAAKSGEKISGQKTLLGLIRILVYLILVPTCWYIFAVINFHVFAKAIIGVFAGYELILLIEKAYELGVIPRRVFERINRLLERFISEAEGKDKKGGDDAK